LAGHDSVFLNMSRRANYALVLLAATLSGADALVTGTARSRPDRAFSPRPFEEQQMRGLKKSSTDAKHRRQLPSKLDGSEIQSPDSPIGQPDLARIASLVAAGQIGLPTNLAPDQLRVVIEIVRERRRQHLVRHIAHCIALDIVSSSKRHKKDTARND
jgi:hypothetical protein